MTKNSKPKRKRKKVKHEGFIDYSEESSDFDTEFFNEEPNQKSSTQISSSTSVPMKDEPEDAFDFPSCSGSRVSWTFHRQPNGEAMEPFYYHGTHMMLPADLFGNCYQDAIRNIFSMKTWNSLSSEEQEYLKGFLPKFKTEKKLKSTLSQLFSGKNFHFGNDVDRFAALFQGGFCHPQVSMQRDQNRAMSKANYRINILMYHNNWLKCVNDVAAQYHHRNSVDLGEVSLSNTDNTKKYRNKKNKKKNNKNIKSKNKKQEEKKKQQIDNEDEDNVEDIEEYGESEYEDYSNDENSELSNLSSSNSSFINNNRSNNNNNSIQNTISKKFEQFEGEEYDDESDEEHNIENNDNSSKSSSSPSSSSSKGNNDEEINNNNDQDENKMMEIDDI